MKPSRSMGALCARLSALGVAAAFSPAALSQGYFDPTGFLPSPWYLSQDWADFAGGVSIRVPAVQVLGGRIAPPPVGMTATTAFDVIARVEKSPGPNQFPNVPGVGTMWMRTAQPGPINVIDTEMLQLDLAGGDLPAGMMIRESPTLASLGRAEITSAPGGFMVDSFFDVFFELSLDGGQAWVPAVQSVRLRGAAVPEPASLMALGLGGLALIRRRRSA